MSSETDPNIMKVVINSAMDAAEAKAMHAELLDAVDMSAGKECSLDFSNGRPTAFALQLMIAARKSFEKRSLRVLLGQNATRIFSVTQGDSR